MKLPWVEPSSPASAAESSRRGRVQHGAAAPVATRTLVIACAVAALVGALGIAFRVWSFRMFAALPTGFDGPMVFRQHYLLEHYDFLRDTAQTYSYWSSVVNAQLGSYLMELINALILQCSAWSTLSPRLIHQLILTPALMGLALLLLLRGQAPRHLALNVAVVSALVTLGTPVVINFLNGWNVAYGWLLLLAVTIVYTSGLSPVWKLGLTLALTFIGPPLYHSFGFLLVTYVVLLWLLSLLLGITQAVPTPTTVGVYYLTYQTYVSVVFFGAILKGLMDVVSLNFLKRDVPVIAVSRINVGFIDLQHLHIVLYGLLSIPVALVVVRYLRALMTRRHVQAQISYSTSKRLKYLTAITAMSCAVGVFAVMFGLKFSFEFLVNRGASYLIIPAVLAIIYELRERERHYWYVYPIALVALAISLFSFSVQAHTVHTATNFTHAEADGYAWLKTRLDAEDVIFTDFRLSGAFIADGYFRVVGITGEGTEPTRALLNAVYYTSSAATVTASIDQIRTEHEGRSADYLFLSTLMMQDYPGLNGYSNRFDPAPPGFFEALDASPDWTLVYRNADARIYQRIGHQP